MQNIRAEVGEITMHVYSDETQTFCYSCNINWWLIAISGGQNLDSPLLRASSRFAVVQADVLIDSYLFSKALQPYSLFNGTCL
jgi:hypothetical protein